MIPFVLVEILRTVSEAVSQVHVSPSCGETWIPNQPSKTFTSLLRGQCEAEGLPAVDLWPQSPLPTILMSIFMLTGDVLKILPKTTSHHYFSDYRTLRMVRTEGFYSEILVWEWDRGGFLAQKRQDRRKNCRNRWMIVLSHIRSFTCLSKIWDISQFQSWFLTCKCEAFCLNTYSFGQPCAVPCHPEKPD